MVRRGKSEVAKSRQSSRSCASGKCNQDRDRRLQTRNHGERRKRRSQTQGRRKSRSRSQADRRKQSRSQGERRKRRSRTKGSRKSRSRSQADRRKQSRSQGERRKRRSTQGRRKTRSRAQSERRKSLSQSQRRKRTRSSSSDKSRSPSNSSRFIGGKPKRPGNGYTQFVKEYAEKYKDADKTGPGFMKTVAEAWKKLSAEEKERYKAKTQDDQTRYQNELALYKEKVQLITKPPNGFGLYLREQWMANDGDDGFLETHQRFSAAWNRLVEQEKNGYTDRSKQLFAEYKETMKGLESGRDIEFYLRRRQARVAAGGGQ